MITVRAKAGVDAMAMAAMRSTLAASHDDVVELAPVSEAAGRHAVMLSVAACQFRLVVLLRFDKAEAMLAHMARLRGMQDMPAQEQWFWDSMSEYGNLCCGALNRSLGLVYPSLGMSTPHLVSGECAARLDMLRPGHLRHLRLALANGAVFHATLAVCEKGELDFLPPAQPQEQAAGELELF